MANARLKVVTLSMLRRLGACGEAMAVFRKTFGQSAVITPDNLTKARRAGLNIEWLIRQRPDLLAKYVERLRSVRFHNYRLTTGKCPRCRAERRASRAVLLEGRSNA